MRQFVSDALVALCCAAAMSAGLAHAQSRNLAPGFTVRAAGTTVVVVPPDMELLSVGMGGVPEPRADWTASAQANFKTGLASRAKMIGNRAKDLTDIEMDEFAQVNALHGAVAQSVALHHLGGLKLPTKDDKLDWSMGDAVKPLRDKTGADYALFFWVRDSYATAERKAAMILLAAAGIAIPLGIQAGYASLVDLRDGRVVWFNRVVRGTGDLRDAKSADETVDALLKDFPALK